METEMKVKKVFVSLVALLEANKDKKVNTIMSDVYKIAQVSKTRASKISVIDTDGKVVAIKCYYFQRWFPLVGDKAVEFVPKPGSTLGYDYMCKTGKKIWNKQNNNFKKEMLNLFKNIDSLDAETIQSEKNRLEEAKNERKETSEGFETQEEVIQYLKENGVKIS